MSRGASSPVFEKSLLDGFAFLLSVVLHLVLTHPFHQDCLLLPHNLYCGSPYIVPTLCTLVAPVFGKSLFTYWAQALLSDGVQSQWIVSNGYFGCNPAVGSGSLGIMYHAPAAPGGSLHIAASQRSLHFALSSFGSKLKALYSVGGGLCNLVHWCEKSGKK